MFEYNMKLVNKNHNFRLNLVTIAIRVIIFHNK